MILWLRMKDELPKKIIVNKCYELLFAVVCWFTNYRRLKIRYNNDFADIKQNILPRWQNNFLAEGNWSRNEVFISKWIFGWNEERHRKAVGRPCRRLARSTAEEKQNHWNETWSFTNSFIIIISIFKLNT
jgi:hypothetical protein